MGTMLGNCFSVLASLDRLKYDGRVVAALQLALTTSSQIDTGNACRKIRPCIEIKHLQARKASG